MRNILCIFLAVLPGSCLTLSAQTEADLGSWCSLQAVKSHQKAFATVRIEHRSFQQMGATECSFAMLGGGYRLTPWLTADLCYEFWDIAANGDQFIHKGVLALTATYKRESLAVSWREKYEQAFPEDDSAYGTLRSRLRAQYTVGSVTPYIMYEYFNGFGGTDWIRSLHYAGAEFRFGGRHCIDLFYMYHTFPKGGTVNACNILGVGYLLSL